MAKHCFSPGSVGSMRLKHNLQNIFFYRTQMHFTYLTYLTHCISVPPRSYTIRWVALSSINSGAVEVEIGSSSYFT